LRVRLRFARRGEEWGTGVWAGQREFWEGVGIGLVGGFDGIIGDGYGCISHYPAPRRVECKARRTGATRVRL
jgi:hypothetical protein